MKAHCIPNNHSSLDAAVTSQKPQNNISDDSHAPEQELMGKPILLLQLALIRCTAMSINNGEAVMPDSRPVASSLERPVVSLLLETNLSPAQISAPLSQLEADESVKGKLKFGLCSKEPCMGPLSPPGRKNRTMVSMTIRNLHADELSFLFGERDSFFSKLTKIFVAHFRSDFFRSRYFIGRPGTYSEVMNLSKKDGPHEHSELIRNKEIHDALVVEHMHCVLDMHVWRSDILGTYMKLTSFSICGVNRNLVLFLSARFEILKLKLETFFQAVQKRLAAEYGWKKRRFSSRGYIVPVARCFKNRNVLVISFNCGKVPGASFRHPFNFIFKALENCESTGFGRSVASSISGVISSFQLERSKLDIYSSLIGHVEDSGTCSEIAFLHFRIQLPGNAQLLATSPLDIAGGIKNALCLGMDKEMAAADGKDALYLETLRRFKGQLMHAKDPCIVYYPMKQNLSITPWDGVCWNGMSYYYLDIL
jgi:hypothetical protein